VLINNLNNSQIDEAILSVTPTSWRKVAFVIGMTVKYLGDNLPQGDTGLDLVADRIEALVHDGRLLAQGDLKKWRHSEVRKPISN
jgi:ABC-type amino acid transport substrate-binding protein